MRLIEFVKSCVNGIDGAQNEGFFSRVSPQIVDDAVEELSKYLKPGMKVLDVGCGNGYALDRFRERGLETYGITVNSDEAIDLNERGHNIQLMDMNFMDFPDGTFNLIWARHSLEHSVVPYWVISECYRMLSDPGLMYVEVPAPSDRGFHEGNRFHFSVMPRRMWMALLQRAGFTYARPYDIAFEDRDRYHAIITWKGDLCQTSQQESTQ